MCDDFAAFALAKFAAELEVASRGVVHVGLIIGATAIEAVQVEPRGAKVHQRINVVALLQAAGRIKSNVMVDELPEE